MDLASTDFLAALFAIVVIDNVVAVAGAAHGSYVLVTLGLLISVPIVIWGSTFLLRFVERYPSFVYLGAGVLAWTAVKMMSSEPLVKDALLANGAALPLLYALVVGGVLGAGLVGVARRASPAEREAPVLQAVAQFAARRNRDDRHRHESERALRPLRSLLDEAGIPYEAHMQVGPRAEVVAGRAISPIERYGVPTGIGGALALLSMAAD